MTGNYVFEEKDFDSALDHAIKNNHADVFVRLKPFMVSAHYEIYVTTAAKNGDLEFMKTFFPNPREEFLMTDRSGNNPIHNAAITGQIEIVKYFLENTKGLTAFNEYRKTPLFYAVINGHLEIVKILMPNPKQKFFKSIGTNRNNMIHIAACKGHAEIVKYFLGNTEGLVARNKYGDTPLYNAVIEQNLEVVNIIADTVPKKYILELNYWGMNVIHIAAEKGFSKILENLCDKVSDPNVFDDFGNFPIHYAAK